MIDGYRAAEIIRQELSGAALAQGAPAAKMGAQAAAYRIARAFATHARESGMPADEVEVLERLADEPWKNPR